MNIIDIYKQFPTQESCIAHLERIRWQGQPTCPYCQSKRVKSYEPTRYFCLNCKTSLSVTVGTIFHKTRLPLQKWFLAIALILNAKKGLSALQLSRDLSINKNTAWRITMQIRRAFSQANQREILSGILEMDETYIGGKPRKDKKHDDEDKPKRGRGTKKTPVVGVIERNGKVRAEATDKLKGTDLKRIIRQFADIKKSGVVTDEYRGYRGFHKIMPHAALNHQIAYTKGEIHTNTIEGFWALLKRGVMGQYHSISRKHLQKYIEEFCYRFNNRGNEQAFEETLTLAIGG
jgi:transposase-like protein